MSFEELYKRISSASATMSGQERMNASILIIDSDHATRNALRQCLVQLDFIQISDAPNHLQGLDKLEQRHFTHCIFDARTTNMPARDFVIKALEMDHELICVAASYEPTIDDVFTLLTVGARGFLVKPFTVGGVDDAVTWASKGEPLSDAILYARDRNEALAAHILTSLDKLAVVMRQARKFDTAKREVPRRQAQFERAVMVGKTFAKGGHEDLVRAIAEFCTERANGPATRIGRVRKRLESRKAHIREEQEEPAVIQQQQRGPI